MKSREMEKLGVPKGPVRKAAIQAVTRARAVGRAKNLIAQDIQAVVENTEAWLKDSVYGDFALMLKNYMSTFASDTRLGDPAPWKQWGEDIDPNAQKQLINACDLPVAVQGALMPDAHLGFGLPIGGVLATCLPYEVDDSRS